MLLLPARYYTTPSRKLAGLIYLSHDTAMQPVISITAPTPPDLKPTVHGRIFRTTTFFADAALFDMVGQYP
jgi:hypothetical protein